MKSTNYHVRKASATIIDRQKTQSIEIITAKHYYEYFKKQKTQLSSIQKKVLATLSHYQKTSEQLQSKLKLSQQIISKLQKQNQHYTEIPNEPLDEQQTIYSKSSSFKQNNQKLKEFAQLIDCKIENEYSEQFQFVTLLKQEFEASERNCERGINILERVVSRKLFKPYYEGLNTITKQQKAINKAYLLKNTLANLLHLLTFKVRDEKEYAFRCILKEIKEIGNVEPTIKVKGKLLMGLKQYPRQSKKNAFYGWYLRSTLAGQALLQKVSNKLVLDTNINKTTAFYRMFRLIKGRRKVVSPQMKRMTMMLYLYSRIYIQRQKQEFFQKFKIIAARERLEAILAQKLIDYSKKRRKQSFKKWFKQVLKERTLQAEKYNRHLNFTKILQNLVNNRVRDYMSIIRLNSKVSRQDIFKKILSKLLKTKIGRIYDALNKWKNLPEKNNFQNKGKSIKFQEGLKNFVERTLRRVFSSFKNQLQCGQVQKKRSVIKLLQVTMGNRKRMYYKWMKFVQKEKLKEQYKIVNENFQMLNKIIKSISDNIFLEKKQSKMKEEALWKIFANMHFNIENIFRRWRQLNKIEKLREKMDDKKKEMCINLLLGVLNNGKQAKIRQVINKFKQNRKIVDIQRNFLKRLLISKAGLVLVGFKAWKNLPQIRDTKKSQKGSKFESGLKRFIDRTLGRAFNAFKNEYQIGQTTKKRAVIQLINVTMGGQKRLYQKWLNMTQKSKLINQCRMLNNVFDNLNLCIKSVTSNFFEDTKSNQIKNDAINKIFQNMRYGVRDSLKKWIEVNRIEKLREKMDDKKKEMCINLLLGVLNNGKQAKIRQVINKFKQNRKIVDIQRNFLKRLLISKAGLVLVGFKAWKNLPQIRDTKKSQKGSKFESGLKRFIDRTLGRAFNAFKNEYQIGQTTKKRAVIQLINVTMGGQKRLYQKWLNMTQKSKLINQCRMLNNVFDNLNLCIKSVTSNFFEDTKSNQIKNDAINKIFQNMRYGVRDSLKKWIEVNRIEKLREKMDDKKKEMCINLLLGVLNNGKQAKIRQVINKFKQNRKIVDIQRNFLKRLLISKAGLVLVGFKAWKNLPQIRDTKKSQKGSKFESGLKRFIDRTLGRAFNAFKNEYQIGQTTKKRAVIQLINVTMGGQKRLYQKWLNMTQKSKLINQCRMLNNVFDNLNLCIKSVTSNFFEDTKSNQIKNDAINKIFQNMRYGVRDSLKKWIEVNRIEKLREKMDDKKKEMCINLLLGVLNNGKQAKIRQVINKFKQNRKIVDIQRNFLKRLLISKAGLVLVCFKAWKNLPQIRDTKKSQKGSKFESGLKRFIDRTLGRAFNAFKNEYQIGQTTKKRAVIQLINVTMGGQKRLYQKWLNMTQKSKLINQCRMLNNVFDNLNLCIKSVTSNFFEDTKSNQIKNDAINKIFQNMRYGVRDSLKKWIEVNRIEKLREKMDDKKKEMCINLLLGVLNNGKQAKIRQVINKFKQNRKIVDIQRNFLKRLLISKAGLVLVGFKAWKNLPQIRDTKKSQKGSKFESGLKRFIDRTLGRAFNAFKNEYQIGQTTKKRAVIQLINVTMGGQKRLYQKWLNMTQKSKLINQCRMLNNVFDNLNLCIKSVTSNFFEDTKSNQIKNDAINKIFQNMRYGVRDSLKKWIEVNRIEKLREKMDDKKKEMCINLLLGVLNNGKQAKIRQVINKFKQNRKIVDIQRNFLKRLLISKAGLVLVGFKAWKNLPQIRDTKKSQKGSKFESGLKRFIDRTLGRAFNAFKNEYQIGQTTKKRAVIQLINVTMGGQKRLYQKWLNMTQKSKLINQCRMLNNVFDNLNLCIKSVTSNFFEDTKSNQIKNDAINKIFQNMRYGVRDSLKKWIEVNRIEKLREKMDDKKKEMCINLLLGVLNNGKQAKIRQVINKFKQNRKIVDIQRNFLKRLLISKAGLVLVGFKAWKNLPQIRDTKKSQKGSKFESGLKRFIDRTLGRAFNAFKNEYQIGQTTKKRAVIQLINVTMGGQKKFYLRWLQSLKQNQTLFKLTQIQTLFAHLTLSLSKTYKPLISKSKFTFNQFLSLNSYCSKVVQMRQQKVRDALHILHQNYLIHKKNPWFKKSAQILALNTRINTQKSFWRLRYNILSTGVVYNAAIIVKLKKLFNNLRKYYELNMFKIFLTIDKYGKNLQEMGAARQRQERITMRKQATGTRYPAHHNTNSMALRYQNHVEKQQVVIVNQRETQIIEGSGTISQQSAFRAVLSSRAVSIQMIDRIFKKNVKKHVSNWRKGLIYQKGGIQKTITVLRQRSEQYEIVSRLGAVECISKIIHSIQQRILIKSLNQIKFTSIKQTADDAYDRSLDQRLQLINRQNVLMQEIRSYKRQNQQLVMQNENKEKCLRECNETVTLLSLRINYMITHKFVGILQKVYEAIEFRNVNDAFDEIIQEANLNFQRQEGMLQDF